MDVCRHTVLQNTHCDASRLGMVGKNAREIVRAHQALWHKGNVGVPGADALGGNAVLPHQLRRSGADGISG